MISDLTLTWILYPVIAIGCVIGALIYATRPPQPPVSVRSRHRIGRQHNEQGEP